MSWAALSNCVLNSCLAIMGEAVLHQPKTGGSFERWGVFSEQAKSIDASSLEIITTQPSLGIRLPNWNPALTQEDRLVIRGVSFWARHFLPDGEGGGTWLLDKISGVSEHVPTQFEPSQFTGAFE